jgi:hypothetical protein
MEAPAFHGARAAGYAPPPISNLAAFLVECTPLLEATPPVGPGGAPAYPLRRLWAFFDEPSAYGLEVPIALAPLEVDARPRSTLQCYVPQLSGLQLFAADGDGAAGAAGTPSARAREAAAAAARPSPAGSACSSSGTASTASTASEDSDDEERRRAPAGKPGAPSPAGRSVLDAARAARAALDPPPPPAAPFFAFAETEPPHRRPPLADRVAELAARCPALLEADAAALHPASWFAVAWHAAGPAAPPATDASAEADLQASFLTLHAFRSAAPSGRPAPGAPGAPRLGVAATAAAAARRDAFAARLGCGALAAALPPFAFLPYRAGGSTWADSYSLRRAHLPMVAAAERWVTARGAALPDLSFYARHAARAGPLRGLAPDGDPGPQPHWKTEAEREAARERGRARAARARAAASAAAAALIFVPASAPRKAAAGSHT